MQRRRSGVQSINRRRTGIGSVCPGGALDGSSGRTAKATSTSLPADPTANEALPRGRAFTISVRDSTDTVMMEGPMPERHGDNAAGDWYIDTKCIDCSAARTVAPGLIVSRGGQSVFGRQPETPEEVMMAWRARL